MALEKSPGCFRAIFFGKKLLRPLRIPKISEKYFDADVTLMGVTDYT
jgi:hypothetical protein